MNTSVLGALAASLLLLAGCASTTVETTGQRLKEPLCRAGQPPTPVVVYWSTKWRSDQKEPELREAAALRGIQDFVSNASCLSVAAVSRLTPEKADAPHQALASLGSEFSPKPERVVLVVVRELGPKVVVGIPVIVEGGTEVVVDLTVLEPQTSVSLANMTTQWRHGGAFVIKGVKTLDQDMSAALRAALLSGGS